MAKREIILLEVLNGILNSGYQQIFALLEMVLAV